MRLREIFGICAIIACIVIAVRAGHAADTQTGSWTIARSDEPGKVQFGLIVSHEHYHSQHETDWPISAFQGVDFSKPGRQDVHFTITRDAGKLDCEGFLDNGEGAGVFHFSPDPNYPREMGSLGFSDIDSEKQYSLAVMDVSLDFAKQMKNERLENLDTDKLIAFKIHGVSPEFIQNLRSAGLNEKDADKLIAFRIHGVSPEFVAKLRAAGLNETDSDKLIAFRIHGVSPDFIQKLQGLGYHHPEPDQLIAMRIHGVTPEFIEGLRSRGMQNLTIDQLVALRVHGID